MSGISYPFTQTGGGNFSTASGSELLKMAIEQIVLTSIGSRPMEKQIGNKLDRLIFSIEGINRDLIAKKYIDEAIPSMDTRLFIENVQVKNTDKKEELIFVIDYFDLVNNVSDTTEVTV